MNNNYIYTKAKKILGKRAKLFHIETVSPYSNGGISGEIWLNKSVDGYNQKTGINYTIWELEDFVKLTHGKPKHLVIKQLLGL